MLSTQPPWSFLMVPDRAPGVPRMLAVVVVPGLMATHVNTITHSPLELWASSTVMLRRPEPRGRSSQVQGVFWLSGSAIRMCPTRSSLDDVRRRLSRQRASTMEDEAGASCGDWIIRAGGRIVELARAIGSCR